MKLDISRDGHIHTELCNHARGSMEQFVQAAIAKGVKGIFFLEHFEAMINSDWQTWLGPEDFISYREEGERLARLYADRIEIELGVELGFNPRHLEITLEFLRQYQWPRVGLSCHFLEIEGVHYNLLSRDAQTMSFFSSYGVERALREYFAILAEGVELLPVHLLCHLDAALRHHPDIEKNLVLMMDDPVFDRIFSAMAKNDIALELNSSGFDHKRASAYPSASLLAKAAEYRLRLIPGSDAHCPEEVGRYFERLSQLADV